LAPVTAGHVFKKGGYKCTLTDKEYKDASNGYIITKKVGTKKVKTWKYKKVLSFKNVWSSDMSDLTTYDYSLNKYYKKGWKWYGSKSVTSSNGLVYKHYAKLKKKVTVKKGVYMDIGYSKFKGKIVVDLYTANPSDVVY
jgi:hypothetical protein